MLHLAQGKPFLSFAGLVSSEDKLKAVRTFILLLFLAQKQRIWLWQDEEFGEIYISVGGNAYIKESEGSTA